MPLLLLISLLMQHSPGYANRFRMWSHDGTPIAVVPYRFEFDSSARPPLLVTARQQAAAGMPHDTTWSQAAVPLSTNTARVEAWGVMVMRRDPEWTDWSMIARGLDGKQLQTIHGAQPARDDGEISLSDLIMGASGFGPTWEHDSVTTPIAISEEFGRRDSLVLSYQVRSSIARPDTRTTITLTNTSNAASGERVLQLQLKGVLSPGVNDIRRSIDASRFPKGRYLMELQVADVRGGASVRSTQFTLH